MTLQQIEKTRNLLARVDSVIGLREMQELASEVKAFYGDKFTIKLKVTVFNTTDTYSQVHENNDRISIHNFLEALLAQDVNANAIIDILTLIEEGETAKTNEKLRGKYISKVFYSYSDKITFDKMTEAIATAPQEILSFNMYQASDVMIDGIITKLKSYASALCVPNRSAQISDVPVQNRQEINFQPQINIEAKNETNITIEAVFENAVRQVKDACLPDAQEKEVLAKIQELKDIMDSKESKAKRWAKIKDFFKWVAEQGIQVASIIVPLLANTVK